jgi:hypothetical protein
MTAFEVGRADIHDHRVVDDEPPGLGSEQARLRVEAFALTSNNVTYAALGDAMSY